MRKIILIIVLLAFPLICFAQNTSTESAPRVTVTTDKSEYRHGDNLNYEVYNGLPEDIVIMKGQHNLNFIEKQSIDGSWQRFGLTMLPEEPLPPGWEPYETIPSGGKNSYTRWLGWLIDIKDHKQVDFTPGYFRLVVEYKFSKEDKNFIEVFSNEFKIIE